MLTNESSVAKRQRIDDYKGVLVSDTTNSLVSSVSSSDFDNLAAQNSGSNFSQCAAGSTFVASESSPTNTALNAANTLSSTEIAAFVASNILGSTIAAPDVDRIKGASHEDADTFY